MAKSCQAVYYVCLAMPGGLQPDCTCDFGLDQPCPSRLKGQHECTAQAMHSTKPLVPLGLSAAFALLRLREQAENIAKNLQFQLT